MPNWLKLTLLGVCMAVSVTTHSASIGQKLLQPLIRYQCQNTLDDSKLWTVSTVLMSTTNKASLAEKVCDCVSENALNDVTNTELSKALFSEESKNKLVRQAVVNSLSICVPNIIRS